MSKVMLVSADGHVGPDIEMYREYIDAKYQSDFDDYLQYRSPTLLKDLNTPESLERHQVRWYDTGKHVSMWDSTRRIEVLEAEGAVAEVLFPDKTRNDEIPFGDAPYPGCPHELLLAGERAYNRWMAEFCRPYANRFAGLVSLQTPGDPEYILQQLRWAAEQPGIRGVLLPGVGPDSGDWLDDDKEPIWAFCEEAGLAVHFHVNSGAPPKGGPHYPKTVAGGMIATIEIWFWTQRALWWLIYGGVLERHPRLRVAFTETGSAWVAEKLATMDWFLDVPYKLRSANNFLPRKPSEYFRRQCALGSSILSLEDVQRRHDIGVENMMVGLDVPHFEGMTDVTVQYLQRTFGVAGVSEPEARAMLGENAVRFYGFDAADLATIAERVGHRIEDVLKKPDDVADPNFQFHWIARPA